jgi:hypothetical protein
MIFCFLPPLLLGQSSSVSIARRPLQVHTPAGKPSGSRIFNRVFRIGTLI